MLADAGVPLLELGQELMAEAVAGVGVVLVGGVFAPGLAEAGKVGFHLRPGCGQHGAQDASFWKLDDWVDSGEAFGPCAAEEFAEDGFGLIVEGMGRGYGVDDTSGHKFAEPGVAEAAGGFFDRFAMLGGFGGGIDLAGVEWES